MGKGYCDIAMETTPAEPGGVDEQHQQRGKETTQVDPDM